MKKVFSLVLAMILIFNFVSFSYADTIDDLIGVEITDEIDSTSSTSGSGFGFDEPETDDSEQPAWGIFSPIVNLILDMLGFFPGFCLKVVYLFPKLDGIIFNTANYFDITIFEPPSNNHAIAGHLQSSISAVYNAFRYLVTAVYIVVLVYLAIRMMLSSIGRQKAKYKEMFKYWLIGLLLLFSFHWVMAGIIWLSNKIVGILYSITLGIMTAPDVSSDEATVITFLTRFTLSTTTPITDYIVYHIQAFVGALTGMSAAATAIPFIGWPILFLGPIVAIIFTYVLIKSVFSIIFTYFKRLFTILILILIFPIVVLSYVFDKIGDRKAQTFSYWIREFVTNVMLQPIHALILAFIGIMFAKASDSLLLTNTFFAPFFCLMALRLLPMGEELLKKLFQISSQMGPGSHGIAGSMAQAGMALRGMREIGGTLGRKLSDAKKFTDIKRQHRGVDSAFKTARDSLRNGGGLRGAKAALNARKNDQKYRDYKEQLLRETGSRTAFGAAAKSYMPIAGMAGGIGSAITGAGQGQFLSKAATNAAINAGAWEAVTKFPSNVRKFTHGNEEAAKPYEDALKLLQSKSNLNDLSKEEKDRLEKITGIPAHQFTEANRASLVAQISAEISTAKHGDPNKAKDRSNFARQQALINKGLMPDGRLAPDGSIVAFDGSKVVKESAYQTKEGFFAHMRDDSGNVIVDANGNEVDFFIGGAGNKDGKVIDPNGMTTLPDGTQISNFDLAKRNYDEALSRVDKLDQKIEVDKDTLREKRKELGRAKSPSDIARLEREIVELEDSISNSTSARRIESKKKADAEDKWSKMLQVDISRADILGGDPVFDESKFELIRKDPTKGSFTMPGIKSDGSIDYTADPRTITGTYKGNTFTIATPRYMLDETQQLVSKFYEAGDALVDAQASGDATAIANAQQARHEAGKRVLARRPELGNTDIDGRNMTTVYNGETYVTQTPDYMLKDATQRAIANYDDTVINGDIEQERLAASVMVAYDSSKGTRTTVGNNEIITVFARNGHPEKTFTNPVANSASMEQAQRVIYQSLVDSGNQEEYIDLRNAYLASLESGDNVAISRASKALDNYISENSRKVSDTFNAYTANPSSAPASTTDFGPSLDLRGLFTSIASDSTTTPPTFTASMLDPMIDEDLFASGACKELSDFLKDTNQQIVVLQRNVANIVVSIKEFGILKPVKEIFDVSSLTMEAIFGDSDDPVTIFSKDGKWYIKEK